MQKILATLGAIVWFIGMSAYDTNPIKAAVLVIVGLIILYIAANHLQEE